MMFLQRQVLGVQFLINRRVNDLRVELFLIVMIVVYPPIDSLFAARWQADAMHIQSVEFWILLRQYPAQWHLSYLKLMFCIMTWSTSFAFVHFIIYINQWGVGVLIDKSLNLLVGWIWWQQKQTKMASRRNSRSHKDRQEIAIQSDPNDFSEGRQEEETRSRVGQKVALGSDGFSRKIKGATNQLLQSIEKAEVNDREKLSKNKGSPLQAKRNVALNVMRLQDKNFGLDKNIFNITIGELSSKQTYLANLQEEIELLKSKIETLQEEEHERINTRTISLGKQPSIEGSSQDESRYDSRKSNCGRIYKRAETPGSDKRHHPKFLISKEPDSSYYKWKPQLDDKASTGFEQVKEQQFHSQKRVDDPKAKSLSNYRVKQKSKQLVPSDSPTKKQRKDVEIQAEPVVEEQPEQLKAIFTERPQWQITSINDDFRSKINAKLQIPYGFPIGQPDISDPLEEYQQKSVHIYRIFGINLEKCKERVIIRKFKNGVYFQLRPNKSIVWYFNGSFYIGDWDNQLPSQAEKNGFGFEYVPNKYYYLGRFRDGNRNGQGTIKVLSKNANNDKEFVGYDGEWLDGKPHGFGKHIDEKNNKYIGNFEHGEKTGKAIVMNKDGLFYEGEMKNGSKNGKGLERLVNGDVYIGNFYQGKFHGPGTYKWKNGSVYQGEFANGKRQGKGIWKSYNGDQFEGQYSNDMKHGWGKFLWKNGEIYEGEFRNDIRHGQGYYKHPNGKIGKYIWKDGHIDHRLQQEQQSQLRKQRSKEEPQPQQS